MLNFILQKRKTVRAAIAAQRRLKANGINETGVSLSVEALPRGVLDLPSPVRAWPGACPIRQRTPTDSPNLPA